MADRPAVLAVQPPDLPGRFVRGHETGAAMRTRREAARAAANTTADTAAAGDNADDAVAAGLGPMVEAFVRMAPAARRRFAAETRREAGFAVRALRAMAALDKVEAQAAATGFVLPRDPDRLRLALGQAAAFERLLARRSGRRGRAGRTGEGPADAGPDTGATEAGRSRGGLTVRLHGQTVDLLPEDGWSVAELQRAAAARLPPGYRAVDRGSHVRLELAGHDPGSRPRG